MKSASILFALSAFSFVWAQENRLDHRPLGDITVVERSPLEGELEASLLLQSEQPLNVRLVGADGYVRETTLEDGETVLSGLPEGLYSLAATGEGLQPLETKLEVQLGETVTVALDARRIGEATYSDDYPPFGSFQVGLYKEISEMETGNLIAQASFVDLALSFDVASVPHIYILGPDGAVYSETNVARLLGVEPGLYTVAGTAEGFSLVEGKVMVRPGYAVEVYLDLEPLIAALETEETEE